MLISRHSKAIRKNKTKTDNIGSGDSYDENESRVNIMGKRKKQRF